MKPLYFSTKILSWYGAQKRDLPWRNTCDPYKIWISEIILQQTRINQGIGYYLRFIAKFPTIISLADAQEDEILKIWQGLGYYSRARNLHFGAKQIVSDFDGKFPNSSKKMKLIKGIGEYTAAAISSIAFNEPIAVVDGNVYRVLSRIYGIEIPIDTTNGQKTFSELANALLFRNQPGEYNQALMEFGALVCKPLKPDCYNCIFKEKCIALALNIVDKLPVKSKKTKVVDRYFNYLVVQHNESIYFNKRNENDIWRNLYDFPNIETNASVELLDLINTASWSEYFRNQKIELIKYSEERIQLLSHQRIHVRFVTITLLMEKNFNEAFIKRNKNDIFELAVPKVIENFLKKEYM